MTEQRAKAHRRSINQSGAEMNVITVPDGTNRICERASFAAQRRSHTRGVARRLKLKPLVPICANKYVTDCVFCDNFLTRCIINIV